MVGRDIPTKAEVNAILAAAEGRWRSLLVTAVFTGMRASELRGLAWDAVDFTKHTIDVRQRADQWGVIGSPKSEAGHREIPMAPAVLNALREWKLSCPRADVVKDKPGSGRLWLVFANGEGKPESHANIINRGFDPIQVKAGVAVPHQTAKDADGHPVMVAKYGMHALRHFFASWAIEQGFSPNAAGLAWPCVDPDDVRRLRPSVPNLEDDHAKFAAGEKAMTA